MLREKEKSQIDALDRFDQQFQNIRKEKKKKHLSRKISKGCLPKKNPRTYHSILSLIAQCGACPFNFIFFLNL